MTLAITSLTVNTSLLEGLTFQNCKIIGPAVVVPMDGTQLLHCIFIGPDLDAIFWEIAPGRDRVVGAIGLSSCTLSGCTLQEIGFAGGPDLREALSAAWNPTE